MRFTGIVVLWTFYYNSVAKRIHLQDYPENTGAPVPSEEVVSNEESGVIGTVPPHIIGEIPGPIGTLRSEESSNEARDLYASVVLLEIVFTDGCRRTCTGAIIHDSAILTAAHCFTMVNNAFLQPELSLSFIVMGTRHMFDTGYEQYLPIERVVTHPNFKGWTADLALVHTFGHMITERTGQKFHLAKDKSTTPVDSNLTVLSWGRCKADMDQGKNVHKPEVTIENNPSISNNSSQVQIKIEAPNKTIEIYQQTDSESESLIHVNFDPVEWTHKFVQRKSIQPAALEMAQTARSNPNKKAQKRSQHMLRKSANKFPHHQVQRKQVEPWLTGTGFNNTMDDLNYEIRMSRPQLSRRRLFDLHRGPRKYKTYNHQPHDWRRFYAGGSQYNELTIGTFGYVNLASCKRLVEKSLPPIYELKNKHEYLCYSSEEFYITNEDSGAPVIQGDELVAITIGGLENDGDHVAVGIRVSCFCCWISENLPIDGHPRLDCKNSCCDEKHCHEHDNKQHESETATNETITELPVEEIIVEETVPPAMYMKSRNNMKSDSDPADNNSDTDSGYRKSTHLGGKPLVLRHKLADGG